MALSLSDLKAQCNVTGDVDNAVLTRCLGAAKARIEASLGFKIDDEDEFPAGTPDDLELAVLMLAAMYYENREATLVNVTAQVLPLGVTDVIADYRKYTFGLVDDGEQ